MHQLALLCSLWLLCCVPVRLRVDLLLRHQVSMPVVPVVPVVHVLQVRLPQPSGCCHKLTVLVLRGDLWVQDRDAMRVLRDRLRRVLHHAQG